MSYLMITCLYKVKAVLFSFVSFLSTVCAVLSTVWPCFCTNVVVICSNSLLRIIVFLKKARERLQMRKPGCARLQNGHKLHELTRSHNQDWFTILQDILVQFVVLVTPMKFVNILTGTSLRRRKQSLLKTASYLAVTNILFLESNYHKAEVISCLKA